MVPRQQTSRKRGPPGPPASAATSMSIPPTSTPAASAYAVVTSSPNYTTTATATANATTAASAASAPAASQPPAASSNAAESAAAAGKPPAVPSPAGPGKPPPQSSAVEYPELSNNAAAYPEPKKECFQKADGTTLCKWTDYGRQNNTDIMNQDDVFDYHNQHAENQGEAVAGKIPGTNIGSALAGIPTGPPAAGGSNTVPTVSFGGTQPAASGGTTVFQGSKEDASAGSQDLHNGPNDYSNHQDGSSHDSIDWKAQTQGQPNGSSTKADIGMASDSKNESLVTSKDGNTDVTATSGANTAGGIDVSNQNAQKGNSTADIDFKDQSKSQMEEHKGNGVHEYHEESSAKGSLNQNFNGGSAIADAGRAYGEMVQSLGSGGHKERRALDGQSEAEQNALTADLHQGLPEQSRLVDMPAANGLQQLMRPFSNSTAGLSDALSISAISDVNPVCIGLGLIAMICGACALVALAVRKRAEGKERRRRLHDAGIEISLRVGEYSDCA